MKKTKKQNPRYSTDLKSGFLIELFLAFSVLLIFTNPLVMLLDQLYLEEQALNFEQLLQYYLICYQKTKLFLYYNNFLQFKKSKNFFDHNRFIRSVSVDFRIMSTPNFIFKYLNMVEIFSSVQPFKKNLINK
ncbi:hypothetical protein BpHYR1_004933 [Brachionus plicatilis]|uniref:Uncharacterized protein n=1 Tax=Brachionus plicatilis TaxID=10195 RepID=A0A3M7S0Y0_BRAPC|nr:hypothetical protein BpHYR1_004933 [Brachionus plicatilis]